MANKQNQDSNTNINSETEEQETVQSTPAEREQFRIAYEALAAERAALLPERLSTLNVSIPNAVNTVLGRVQQIRGLAEAAKTLPSFDAAGVEKIESYAQALAYAHMLYNIAAAPIEELPGLGEQAAVIRERLSSDATVLAQRGLVDGSRLRDLRGGNGYKELGYDVGSLVALLRKHWPAIAGKTAVTQEELTDAQVVTEKLLVAVAAREQQSANISVAAGDRLRAFTLLNEAYDQVVRAATYLHWNEDVSSMFPSFFSHGSRKRTQDEPAAVEPTLPATPAVSNGASPTAAPGMPGASPFGS